MNVNWIVGRNFLGQILSFGLLALILTGLLTFLPTYSESDYWGKALNNFLYFIAFYLAARWAMGLERGKLR